MIEEVRVFELVDEDGNADPVTLKGFFECNEFDPDEEARIRGLGVGEAFEGGGGAQPRWCIRRVEPSVIETLSATGDARQWTREGIGENRPRTAAECERGIVALRALGGEWATAEYRVTAVSP
jgi:hypothetical protein